MRVWSVRRSGEFRWGLQCGLGGTFVRERLQASCPWKPSGSEVCTRAFPQGLGLYAARDIEKHTMVIEYIGTIIRNEVANRKEKLYESQVSAHPSCAVRQLRRRPGSDRHAGGSAVSNRATSGFLYFPPVFSIGLTVSEDVAGLMRLASQATCQHVGSVHSL